MLKGKAYRYFLKTISLRKKNREMKSKIIFLIASVLFFFISSVYASEPPVLVLDEETTTIALSLVNHSDSDLSAVTASIDREKLPVWLTIQSTPQTVNIPRGAKSQNKLLLRFTVKDAPAGAEMFVPITLRDAYGNIWNSPVLVRASTGSLPLQNALYENYPNPFNPSTTIKYSLKEAQKTSLVIYNSLGQKIRTLIDAPQSAGIHNIQWDGKNDRRQQVSSGVYFFKLNAGKFVQTKRMMMME